MLVRKTPLKRTPIKKSAIKKKAKKSNEPTQAEKIQIRYVVGQRDGPWCFRFSFLKDWPNKFCTGVTQEIHHVIPRSRPFKKLWDVSNQIGLCTSCHSYFSHNKKFREAIIRKLKELYDYPFEEPEFQEYLG